jgi:hypothetical protein
MIIRDRPSRLKLFLLLRGALRDPHVPPPPTVVNYCLT